MLWIDLDCFGTDVSGIPPGRQDQKHPPPSSVMVGGKNPELNGQKMWKMRFTSSPCFHPHHFENAASSESMTESPWPGGTSQLSTPGVGATVGFLHGVMMG